MVRIQYDTSKRGGQRSPIGNPSSRLNTAFATVKRESCTVNSRAISMWSREVACSPMPSEEPARRSRASDLPQDCEATAVTPNSRARATSARASPMLAGRSTAVKNDVASTRAAATGGMQAPHVAQQPAPASAARKPIRSRRTEGAALWSHSVHPSHRWRWSPRRHLATRRKNPRRGSAAQLQISLKWEWLEEQSQIPLCLSKHFALYNKYVAGIAEADHSQRRTTDHGRNSAAMSRRNCTAMSISTSGSHS